MTDRSAIALDLQTKRFLVCPIEALFSPSSPTDPACHVAKKPYNRSDEIFKQALQSNPLDVISWQDFFFPNNRFFFDSNFRKLATFVWKSRKHGSYRIFMREILKILDKQNEVRSTSKLLVSLSFHTYYFPRDSLKLLWK